MGLAPPTVFSIMPHRVGASLISLGFCERRQSCQAGRGRGSARTRRSNLVSSVGQPKAFMKS